MVAVEPPSRENVTGASRLEELLCAAGGTRSLRGAELSGEDLRGVDLSDFDLSGARLCRARLQGADLSRAELLGADLSDADLTECRASRTGLGNANLSGAILFGAFLEGATLAHATLDRADLRSANLEGARLRGASLVSAELAHTKLRGADLSGTDVGGASFEGADVRDCRMRGIRGAGRANWIDADILGVDFCGAYLVRREIEDQNYLHEFRNRSRTCALVYRLWWLTSDCGRSFLRWGLWTVFLAVVFAGLYETVQLDYGDHRTFLSSLYYSVVTLTTLGYGDVVPASPAAQIVAIVEVTIGYVMLGGLLSIFSNKMARRAS